MIDYITTKKALKIYFNLTTNNLIKSIFETAHKRQSIVHKTKLTNGF